MDKQLLQQLHKRFEEYGHEEEGIEFWYARDLQNLLDYTEWRNFYLVLEKAKIACENVGQQIADHFVDVNKTIKMSQGVEKQLLKKAGLNPIKNSHPRRGFPRSLRSLGMTKEGIPARITIRHCEETLASTWQSPSRMRQIKSS